MFGAHALSIVIWLPIVGGFPCSHSATSARAGQMGRRWRCRCSPLASLPLYAGFKTGTAAMQFVERAAWIPSVNAQFAVGIDGISLPLILLTTFTTVLIVIAGWGERRKAVSHISRRS